ncbi:phosphotransferase [Colletotrichum eremochloae]|nr:phosphotransferase [Colletotrichum eremochloae]
MYDGQEELDNLVWDKNDEDSDEAQNRMRLKSTCRKVEDLAKEKFGKPATLISPLISGGFNVHYRIRLEGTSPDVMVRLPFPSLVPFPGEKTIHEAATAAFIAKQTQLPIPRQLFYGQDSTVGPFVVMERIENCGTASSRLTIPSDDPSTQHVLDPNVSETTLEDIWGKVARCLLRLSQITFPRIGSLVETKNGIYEVAGRPITHNMTDMVRLANIPRSVLPPKGKTYETADEWYTALADMHIAQLIFQHNDLVTSEDDCRNKYVARQLFRRLARQGRLSTFGFAEDDWSAQASKVPALTVSPAPSSSDHFRLWGDDFRTGNILLTDTDEIAALVDWEYAYAGPTQITWLSAMKKAEAELPGPIHLSAPLSTYMRESWETGRFFLSYGARKSWAFDTMYWRFLDEKFFGDREKGVLKDDLWKTRVHLLSEDERAAMDPFVERKMAESKERRIVSWDPTEAKQRFSELLFD